jgi:hypothetical protein
MLKTTSIRKSLNGMTAMTNSCFPVGPKNSSKRTWMNDKDLYLGYINEVERVLTPVYIATDEHKITYLMDAITGTLYRQKDKKCMSSDQLVLKKYEKVDGLNKRLMEVKSEQFSGSNE